MGRKFQHDGDTIQLGKKLFAGGEAVVYEVRGKPDLLAKLYHPNRLPPTGKLEAMVKNPPEDPTLADGHRSIAWVRFILRRSGRDVGFVMDRIRGGVPVHRLFNPRDRMAFCPGFTWRYLHTAALNLAVGVGALHARGYVIGDLNESNVLVHGSAMVSLVDSDSMQVTDSAGRVYRCAVGKPEYTAPEIQGHDFADFDRTEFHDRFALGVLIHQTLMEGWHPFAGCGDPPALEDRVRSGLFPWRRGAVEKPPPAGLPLEEVHPAVADLFRRCFDVGHRHPSARPSPAEWKAALGEAVKELVRCPENPHHEYLAGRPACTWCERKRLLRVDSFPREAVAVRPVPARRTITARMRAVLPFSRSLIPPFPTLFQTAKSQYVHPVGPTATIPATRRFYGDKFLTALVSVLLFTPLIIGIVLRSCENKGSQTGPTRPPGSDRETTPTNVPSVRLDARGLEPGDERLLAGLARYPVKENLDPGTGKPYPPGHIIRDSDGMAFAYVPPGMFFMGSPLSEPDREPDEVRHAVLVSRGFRMGVTEVTQEQWRRVMGSNPSRFKESELNAPVESVSWDDARAFLKKLNARSGNVRYRLPTEAEWEYACRAGTWTPYAFGETLGADQANLEGEVVEGNRTYGLHRRRTVPVGSFQPNTFGLHDMHGNVCEWVSDIFGPYDTRAAVDPTGARAEPGVPVFRVARGGGWFSTPNLCRSARRWSFDPGERNGYLGFRLVREDHPPASGAR